MADSVGGAAESERVERASDNAVGMGVIVCGIMGHKYCDMADDLDAD